MIGYVAMVTGLISFFSPEYSPISSSVSEVRLSSSLFHCRPLTVLVTRMSVVAPARGTAAPRARGGPVGALRLPRPSAGGVGGEGERGRPGAGHRRGADQGLAGAAGQ